jgi:hypothetical protein
MEKKWRAQNEETKWRGSGGLRMKGQNGEEVEGSGRRDKMERKWRPQDEGTKWRDVEGSG